MKKGDLLHLNILKKAYLGRPHGMPDLKAAMLQVDGTTYFRLKILKMINTTMRKVQVLQKHFYSKFLYHLKLSLVNLQIKDGILFYKDIEHT